MNEFEDYRDNYISQVANCKTCGACDTCETCEDCESCQTCGYCDLSKEKYEVKLGHKVLLESYYKFSEIFDKLYDLEQTLENDDSRVGDLRSRTRAQLNTLMTCAAILKYGIIRYREGLNFSNPTTDIVMERV